MSKFLEKIFGWIPTPVSDYYEGLERSRQWETDMLILIMKEYQSKVSHYEQAVIKQKAKPTLRLIEGGLK